MTESGFGMLYEIVLYLLAVTLVVPHLLAWSTHWNEPVEISNLDVLEVPLGFDRSCGAINGKVTAGPMTDLRMGTDDTAGEVRAYLGEGEFTDDSYGNRRNRS